MNIQLIVSLAIAVYFLAFIGIYLLKSRKKHWAMTLIRLCATIVAAIVAIPVCVLGLGALTDFAYDLLVPGLPSAVTNLLEAVYVGAEGMRVLLVLVIAPLLYPAVFLLLHRIFMIVAWILEKFVPVFKSKKKLAVSLPLGALNGLIIAVVLVVPTCGFLTMGAHLVTTFMVSDGGDPSSLQTTVQEEFDLEEDDLLDVALAVENQPAVYWIHNTVGKPMFNALTTAKLDPQYTHGEVVEMHLETELNGLCKAAGLALDVVESVKHDPYTAEDKELLFATADSFFESDWIRMLAADSLAVLADSWLRGESFLGMDPPSMDAAIKPAFDSVLTVLSTETAATLEEDIHDILDVFGDFLVYDLFETGGDYAALVQKLGSSGLLDTTLEKLQANPRLAVLVTELKAMSIRLVTNMLGTEALENGEYSEMMGNVADTLTDALDMPKEERDALVVNAVRGEFADRGYDVPEDVAIGMSDQLMAELGADGEITEEELTDYLINHADELPY